jgi:hypothetical protein
MRQLNEESSGSADRKPKRSLGHWLTKKASYHLHHYGGAVIFVLFVVGYFITGAIVKSTA